MITFASGVAVDPSDVVCVETVFIMDDGISPNILPDDLVVITDVIASVVATSDVVSEIMVLVIASVASVVPIDVYVVATETVFVIFCMTSSEELGIVTGNVVFFVVAFDEAAVVAGVIFVLINTNVCSEVFADCEVIAGIIVVVGSTILSNVIEVVNGNISVVIVVAAAVSSDISADDSVDELTASTKN